MVHNANPSRGGLASPIRRLSTVATTVQPLDRETVGIGYTLSTLTSDFI
jgi:hypothetical protein